MCGKLRARWLFLTWILLAAWFIIYPAAAQVRVTVRISPPTTNQFPQVTLFVAVVDSTGRYIPGLPPSNFSVLEDESPISEVTIHEKQVGTRQVYVINTTSGLKLRDAHGRTRFDLVRQALLDWWQLPTAILYGIDNLSLVTAEGALVTHSKSAADLASTLTHLTPTFEDNISGYDLLLRSLDFTTDPVPIPGMPTHLIFITPLLLTPRDLPIANVMSLASETGTVLYPVLVGPPEVIEQPEAEPLRQLAEATGGQLLLFDPSQGLNHLADQILAQRTQYQLTYTSRAVTSGTHQIQIRVTGDELDALSNTHNFEIDVRPPEVTFIQPPDEIVRQTDDPTLALADIPPTSQTIRLLVTFPDKHPRTINTSQFVVDGAVISQCTEPPFDLFEWDLSGYLETETHTIQVIVEDSLGMQGTSIAHSVGIKVLTPPRGLAALKPALGSILAAFAVIIAGIVLAVVMISMGRQRLVSVGTPDQPTSRIKSPLRRAGLRRRSDDLRAEAHLIPIDALGTEGEAVPLTGTEFILGSDPSLTPFPLEDPSVAGLHARLTRQAAGGYRLRDQGSVAGTWINYELVPDEGRKLKHGDLVHIGRKAFRFRLPAPPPPSEVRIRPANDAQPSTPTSQESAT